MKAGKLTRLALLTALALIIFIVELHFPNLIPLPGVKLGLANIITVYAVYKYRPKEVALIVTARLILGALFAGNVSTLMYSGAGAILCLAGMLLFKKVIPYRYIWLSSVVGAILHNTGQVIVAILVIGSFAVVSYYPILIISGCIAGAFTGICAQLLLKRDLHGQCISKESR